MAHYAVETRGGRFFVVDREAGRELAPVFDSFETAHEIAHKATRRVPFFENIPEVPADTPEERDCAKAIPRSLWEKGIR